MKEITRIGTSCREEGLYKIITLEWEENGFPCFCDVRVSADLEADDLNADQIACERFEQLLAFFDSACFDELADMDLDEDHDSRDLIVDE